MCDLHPARLRRQVGSSARLTLQKDEDYYKMSCKQNVLRVVRVSGCPAVHEEGA